MFPQDNFFFKTMNFPSIFLSKHIGILLILTFVSTISYSQEQTYVRGQIESYEALVENDMGFFLLEDYSNQRNVLQIIRKLDSDFAIVKFNIECT